MDPVNLVSVIMPAHNSAVFISESINSVLQQTHVNIELIVIDDGSTDETVSIVKGLIQKDPRILLLENQKNLGPGPSRNAGIKAAKGDFIAFLDSDDLWLTYKLEKQLRFMKEHNLSMCFSSYLLIDETGTRLNKIIEALPVLTYPKLLLSNYVGNLTGIYDARDGKYYSPDLRKRQDWGLWLNIVKQTGPARGIMEPLAVYRIRNNSLSRKKYALLKHNYLIYRDFLNFGILKSTMYMSRFLWEHFFVKRRQEKQLNK